MSEERIKPSLVVVPTPGIDPLDALATSMYASPGLYTVLLGAGMSLSAGQLGAWGILYALIGQVARSSGDDLDISQESPFDWWKRHSTQEPHYGAVLESLGSTPGARQQLLKKYFLPDGNGERSEIAPAYEYLAKLCAMGIIKVVLTTNFDRLIEQALSANGVNFQLIQPSGISGMTPLVHAPVTVIKLHGDYQSLDIRNTPQELSQYPRPLTRKLREILRDFGLIVVGWSGKWDNAIRDLIERNASRIYPMYWVAHNGELTESAKRLVANRQANQINSQGAENFFSDLSVRIDHLSRVAKREKRPTFIRNTSYQPWMHYNLSKNPKLDLLLRTAVTFGPSTSDNSGLITPVEWRKIITAIDCHSLSNQLRDLAGTGLLFAQGPQRWRDKLPRWEISKTDLSPSGDSIAFRISLHENVFARLIVAGPAHSLLRDNFLTLLDIGVSLSRLLSLDEAATILIGSLDILSNLVPEALADIKPQDALPNLAELYIARPGESGGLQHYDLDQFVDLSSWGDAVRPSGGNGLSSLDAAVRLHGPLTPRGAADLTVRAIERMALNNSYIDYETGISEFRKRMMMGLID